MKNSVDYSSSTVEKDKNTRLGDVQINIWPDVPQIEIWTTKGQSCVLSGQDAIDFAKEVKEALSEPILLLTSLKN